MAIQKPYEINIRGLTVDGNDNNSITWKVTGSMQYHYRIEIISNNSSLPFSYASEKIASYTNRHTLAKKVLPNGREYKIRIVVWDLDGNSATSDYEVFQTSSRPVLKINMPSEIYSQSFRFEAQYTQSEDIKVKSWTAYLYNEDMVKIDDSNIKTTSVLEYIFQNMLSEKTYYVEFTASSEKGLVATTGIIPFYVIYNRPVTYVHLNAENTDDAGIELTWNVIQIIGKSTNTKYIDDEKIDARDGRVVFDEGFSLNQDFTLKIWFENPVQNVDLVTLYGSTGTINLQLWDDNTFRLFKHVNGYKSCYVSRQVDTTGKTVVIIQQVGDDLNILANEVSN